MSKRHPGVRRKGRRWEVDVRVRGQLYSKTFPLDTPMSDMQQWRARQKQKAPERGTLDDAIQQYLATVKHMPSYADRARDLETWSRTLGGHRSRSAITTQEIDAALSGWLTEGYSATTVQHRRTALLHLYHRLDGKDAPNPVRRAQRPQEAPPEPRYIPADAVRDIVNHIPWKRSRARLRLMAATGLPQKLIGQLTAASYDHGALLIPARRKGKGAPMRRLPLSHQGRRAWQAFVAAKAFGPFSNSMLHKVFRQTRDRLGYPATWRPYDLRHTVGAWLYEATGDLATVARLLGISSATASRYAASAHAVVDAAAMSKAGKRLAKVGR